MLTPGSQGLAPPTLLAPYLVLISMLTLPHVVIVAWMNHRQGLWRRPEGEGGAQIS